MAVLKRLSAQWKRERRRQSDQKSKPCGGRSSGSTSKTTRWAEYYRTLAGRSRGRWTSRATVVENVTMGPSR